MNTYAVAIWNGAKLTNSVLYADDPKDALMLGLSEIGVEVENTMMTDCFLKKQGVLYDVKKIN